MSDSPDIPPPPEKITLGATGLTITRLGIGAARLHMRDRGRAVTTRQAITTIHAALEAGIGYFDTAPRYGQGESETTLGDALASHRSGPEPIVSTKVGNYPDNFPNTAQATIDSVHASLGRLHRTTIDLVQVHELEPDTVNQVLAPGGVVDGLDELREQRVVHHVGFTTSNVECAVQALDSSRFETAMLWRRADLLDDSMITAVGPIAERAGVAVVIAAPFAAGLLTTGGDESGRRRRRPPPQTLARVRSLRGLCHDHGVEIESVAMHFALRQPGTAAVVAGVQDVVHVHEQLAWLNAMPPESIWPDVTRLRAAWAEDPDTALPGD